MLHKLTPIAAHRLITFISSSILVKPEHPEMLLLIVRVQNSPWLDVSARDGRERHGFECQTIFRDRRSERSTAPRLKGAAPSFGGASPGARSNNNQGLPSRARAREC